MKKLFVLLLLIAPMYLMAQVEVPKMRKDAQLIATESHDPLLIVDSVKMKKFELAQMNPDDIESITVLKDAASTVQYGLDGVNGVILITTKKFADKAYRDKIGELSNDYKTYLTEHHNNDQQIIYMINGVKYSGGNRLSKMAGLTNGSIEQVFFKKGEGDAATVVITTTKQ
jgi:TonB-dependent SusC/RagA subfamily outer membrane receptor